MKKMDEISNRAAGDFCYPSDLSCVCSIITLLITVRLLNLHRHWPCNKHDKYTLLHAVRHSREDFFLQKLCSAFHSWQRMDSGTPSPDSTFGSRQLCVSVLFNRSLETRHTWTQAWHLLSEIQMVSPGLCIRVTGSRISIWWNTRFWFRGDAAAGQGSRVFGIRNHWVTYIAFPGHSGYVPEGHKL